MRITPLLFAALVAAGGVGDQAQRRSGGSATFAISVSDPGGAPLGGVTVTVGGPASRSATTERGRIAFENLPAGMYRLRFEREGFVTLEREVAARGGAPIDVKVTLTPAPKPPPPPPAPVEPVPPPPPTISADPVSVDMTEFLDKNFVGRAAGKTSQLACSTGGTATLIQLNKPLPEHVHADADEFLYVVAGEGTARAGDKEQRLRTGIFMLVPRGVSHSLAASGRSPLVVLSTRAGERCAAASPATR
jgi:mannose-6-phosphate isomerase-like protein (cupin superfamily)